MIPMIQLSHVIQIQRNPWTACRALAGPIPYNNPRAPACASAQSSQIKKRDHLVIVVRDIRQEIAGLRKVVKVVTEVNGRKRKYIRVVESLTVGKVTNLIAKREGSR
jgi:hypothetical protein